MIAFDKDKTAEFFNKVYKSTDADRGAKPRLHARDEIFLTHILPRFSRNIHILDYGCGAGRLLAEVTARGYDAVGLEKHAGMYEEAAQVARVQQGGIETLRMIPSASYDLIIAMGVFQYLPKDEYDQTVAEFTRILKPLGTLVATYQNAFFDLFTFNRYTAEFMKNNFGADVRELITNPDKPDYSNLRARDNIFVHTTNPLTLRTHLDAVGLDIRDIYFYEYFGQPPLLGTKPTSFEVNNATAWQGHFMANAFLVHATKCL